MLAEIGKSQRIGGMSASLVAQAVDEILKAERIIKDNQLITVKDSNGKMHVEYLRQNKGCE